jgi:glycosyltransferase involved in cell wall biosynthesis
VTAVHFVVPEGVDDPRRPSGGNTYDREVCRALSSIGWSMRKCPVPGAWPRRDAASLAALAEVVQRIPDDAIMLVDGLIASTAPEVLVPHARRLRFVVLVHMLLGHRAGDAPGDTRTRELSALSAGVAVVTTSAWTQRRALELYSLPADLVHVAEPGVEAAELATPTGTGGALLCVAAVSFDKGHDVLLDALEMISELSWDCVCVGSLDGDVVFVEDARRRVLDSGLGHRVHFPGPRTGADLDRSYAAADVIVSASRAETYGMVLTEALARGLPVVAADVGGVREAIGYGAARIRPGLLVPPEDPTALAAALRGWLGDAGLRGRLRQAARERRGDLSGWSRTASILSDVLAAVGQ